MSRKEINIGIEGNDGTGDSIRDSFQKVNDNFEELYSVLGFGKALRFTGLSDTPDSFELSDNNKVLVVDGDNERVVFKELIGSSTIVISYEEEGKIRINSLASALINDSDPRLSNNLDANFKRIINLEQGQLNTDAATKGYVDGKLSIGGIDDPQSPSFGIMTGPLVLSRNPIDSDDVNFGGRVAATKAYVDSKSFSSDFNIYVATNGDDDPIGIPLSQIGRSPASAYRTIQKACETAEALVDAAPIELGPYQKTLTFNNGTGVCTLFSISRSPLSGAGAKAIAKMGVDTVEIVSPGTGYSIGDELSLSADGIFTEPAILTVIAVNFAGGISQLSLTSPGVYTTLPDNIDSVTLIGGANTGAAVSVRYKVVAIDVTDSGGEKTRNVIGATRANPVVVTTDVPHDYETGDEVTFDGVGGMIQLNGNEYFINVINNTTFELYQDPGLSITVNGTVFNLYTTGGTVTEGADFGRASVVFNLSQQGTGFGAEATTNEIGGLIREITVVNSGSGYNEIPSLEIFLPRLLLETENKGTDFLDDLREGQLLRGKISNAYARIVSHDGSREGGREIFDVDFVSGAFILDEPIEYGEPTKNIQITIWVESGFYQENYPLRLPPNVTLRGTDFRRVVIRPKPGVSRSPWVRRFFRRDTVIDGLRVTPVEFGYHYLTDPLDFSSEPKNNDEVDVILCNDATRLIELTFQGHGGFNMVLDPEGQILSKSPYFQSGTTISKSDNTKTFAGGQFVDGFSGNLPGILLGNVAGSSERVIIGGLDREPQLPTSFVIDGEIFRITLATEIETEYFSTKLLLEANRSFIAAETIAFVNANFPNLEYDEETCRRDVKLIIDSIIKDALYGGYFNSAQAGRLYFKNGRTVVDGQVAETIAAINRAKSISADVIRQVLVNPINDEGLSQTTIISIQDSPSLINEQVDVVNKCFDIITNIIEYGEKIYAAKKLIAENREYIQSEVIEYINNLYPALQYNQALCFRDVGLILDALSIDIFGDFNNSIRAGYSYFSKGTRFIPTSGPEAQLPETIDGITYAGVLAKRIIQGLPPETIRTSKVFNPAIAVDIEANRFTIPNHGFTTGSRVKYSNGGGETIQTVDDELVDGNVYFVFVIDGNRFQLVQTFDLLVAKEKTGNDSIRINLSGIGEGIAHSFSYDQTLDPSLTTSDLTNAGVLSAIDTGISYINTILAGNSQNVPSIFPQWECFLDTPYTENFPSKIELGTAGNKSMLGNDYTQVNDMGYGIFATNNGLIESVSVFTYYCFTAYFALNGAQIRCLNGSSAHGVFALKSEGADPNEIPDEVKLKYPLVQTAVAYTNEELSIDNVKEALEIFVTGYSYDPLPGSIIEIDHTDDPGGTRAIGYFEYIITAVTVGTQATQDAGDLPIGVAKLALSAEGTPPGLRLDVPDGKPLIIRINEEIVLSEKENIVATRPSTALIWDEDRTNTTRILSFAAEIGGADGDVVAVGRDGFNYVRLATRNDQPDGHGAVGDTYISIDTLNFVNSNRVTFSITGEMIFGAGAAPGGMIFGFQDSIYEILNYEVVYPGLRLEYGRINFRNISNPSANVRTVSISGASQTNPVRITTSVPHKIYNGTAVTIGGISGMTQLNGNTYFAEEVKETLTIVGVSNTVPVRITTSTPHNLANGDLVSINGVQGISSINSEIYYVKIHSSTEFDLFFNENYTDDPLNGTSTETFGEYISGGIVTVDEGSTKLDLYLDRSLTNSLNGSSFSAYTSGGTITLEGGLTSGIEDVNGNLTLSAGLRSGATGDVTVNISTMRATGHDMLDIGTGSYADTNYPNNIYGPPGNPVNQDNEAVEVGKGRVFFVSTDQSGNFRVGDLFGIDQGTGAVKLGAKISLTNVQALRLKAGAEIFEFSTDSTLGGEGGPGNDQVPTEAAVRTYIDRRLGRLHSGGLLLSGLIGPGFLALDGSPAMKGPIDMNNFPINNLPSVPVLDRAAVPKSWVRLANLRDAPSDWLDSTPAYNTFDADLLTFTGDQAKFINATVSGAITLSRTGRSLTATINPEVIDNSNINSNAAIDQSKLNLTLSSSRATAPTGSAADKQAASGLSTFDNVQFSVVDGFVTIPAASTTTNGVGINRLSHLDPLLIDPTDESTTATTGKVLGRRRGSGTGSIVPIDFKTVISDGDGLSRAEVPTPGIVRRIESGVGEGKFDTISFGTANQFNPEGTLVQRDTTDGGFSAGSITVTNVTVSTNLTAPSLRITAGTSPATTQTVITRVADGSGTGDFYTDIKDGNGGIGIRINSSTGGSGSGIKQYTDYYANVHNFKRDLGESGGVINVGSGGNITSGSESTAATFTGQWSLTGASRLTATWADLAEYYVADKDYEPGTVLVFGGDNEVTTTTTQGDTRVAGVVSENPAFLMNQECAGNKVAIALQGRVPCKVIGKISKGDLIISSGIRGVGISAKNEAKAGTILGKALENYDSDHIGLIEVAVGRL